MSRIVRPSFLPLKSNSQSSWPSEFYSFNNKPYTDAYSPSSDSGVSTYLSNSSVLTPRTPITPSDFNREFKDSLKSPPGLSPLNNVAFKYFNSPIDLTPTVSSPNSKSVFNTHVLSKILNFSPQNFKKDLYELEDPYEYDLKSDDKKHYDLEFLLQFKDNKYKISSELQTIIKELKIERKIQFKDYHLDIKQIKDLAKQKENEKLSELDLNNSCGLTDLNKKDKKNFEDTKKDSVDLKDACCDLTNCCCSTVDPSPCPDLFNDLMALADAIFASQCLFLTTYPNFSTSHNSTSNFELPVLVDTKFCKFCKNNREPRSFYLSHQTRDKNGKVVCPILKTHKCEVCGETGEKSHTRSYCPYSKMIRSRVADTNKSYLFYNVKSMIHHESDDLNETDIINVLTDTSDDE